tara:strand:+ start:14775 stop:15416 length:642 start_codon:yes stop_codon:yes gene_type:complete
MSSEIKVSSVKAKDGTAGISIADSTGNITASGTLTATGALTASGGIKVADGGNIGSASDPDAMSISSGGIVTKSQVVGFGGCGLLPADTNAYCTLNVNLYFSNVRFNSGHFVNASGTGQGEFTCPVSGVYWVFGSVLVDNDAGTGDLCRFELRHGGSASYIGYDKLRSSANYEGMITAGGVVNATSGDIISMVATDGKLHVGSESAFSVYLLG